MNDDSEQVLAETSAIMAAAVEEETGRMLYDLMARVSLAVEQAGQKDTLTWTERVSLRHVCDDLNQLHGALAEMSA